MPQLLRARAILFDMDGVLVDSGAAIDRVRRRWARRCGLDEEMVARLPQGQKTRDIVAGLAPARDLEEEVAWLDADEARDTEGIVAIRGAGQLLASLAPDTWAIVTSSGLELARLRLAAAGLPSPATIVSGEQVRHGKPSPEGYLRGAELLGRRPEECIVVEDAIAGMEAGIAARMQVIGVTTHYSREQLARCDWVVDDLSGFSAKTSNGTLELTLHSGR